MIGANVTLTEKDKSDVLEGLLREISRMEVYVGIPEKDAPREGDDLSNAQLAFIHTHGARAESMREEMDAEMAKGSPYSAAHQMYIRAHGSPLYHIPPRPIIEPAIEAEDNKEAIADELAAAAKAVLDAKPDEARRRLDAAGLTAQNAVRGWFEDPRNAWPENAPATVGHKGSDAPLIDTGEMRKSITYVVKEKG